MSKSEKFPEEKIEKSIPLELTEDECYCDIVSFYNLLAVKSGIDPGSVRYNCTKIHVTDPVRKKIFDFYDEQESASDSDIAMAWVFGGPIADLKHEGYFAEIKDGFFIEELK